MTEINVHFLSNVRSEWSIISNSTTWPTYELRKEAFLLFSVFNFNWVLLLSLGNGSHVYILSKTMQFRVILSDNFRQFVIECVVVFRFSLAVQFLFVSAKRYWHNIRIFPFCYVYVRSCCVGGLAILELPQIVNTHVSIFLVQNTDNKMLNKHVDVAEIISF